VAFTTWLSDGVRALDVSNPASPKEVGSFVPPAVNDPSPAAGARVSNLDIGDPNNLLRGQSWPNRPLATGVGVIPRSPTTATVVVRDINGGLYVLNAEVDPVTGSPPPGGGGPGPGPGPGPIPGLLPRANLPGLRLGVRRLVRGRRTIFLSAERCGYRPASLARSARWLPRVSHGRRPAREPDRRDQDGAGAQGLLVLGDHRGIDTQARFQGALQHPGALPRQRQPQRPLANHHHPLTGHSRSTRGTRRQPEPPANMTAPITRSPSRLSLPRGSACAPRPTGRGGQGHRARGPGPRSADRTAPGWRGEAAR